MSTHATLSPSSASRWLHCPGSVALHAQVEDTGSSFAAEGTAAHFLAEKCLTQGVNADSFIDMVIVVHDVGTDFEVSLLNRILTNPSRFTVGDEMAGYVQQYVDYVRSIPGELMVEQRLSISHLTGEENSFGTSDAVILAGDEIVIVDLKYGRGVKVDAERNEQLAIYALAALNEFEFLGDFKRARLVIHQPRLSHVSEWEIPIDGPTGNGIGSLNTFAEQVTIQAAKAIEFIDMPPEFVKTDDLNPAEKTCRWCGAKATCKALAKKVQDDVGAEFDAMPTADSIEQRVATAADDTLAIKMAAVDLIEDWCKAVRAEVERRLFAGIPVAGYKLVEGRRGSRKWTNAEEVEATMKSMRLKLEEMYDFSLISPTTADKLHKAGTIGPRQWPRLQELITQSEGKPSVAPASDKRPPLVIAAAADEFADLTTVEDLV